MSIARHHAEWLSLVEASGPFLSLPVLSEAFPQGLNAHDPDHAADLRLAYEEWEEDRQSRRPTAALHRAWIKYVLRETLGYSDRVLLEGQSISPHLSTTIAEHGETLRPDFVLTEPRKEGTELKPRLLIQYLSAGQELEKIPSDKRWKVSPATRMMELLHATGVRLGLVTNGHQWMLINAPHGESTGFISWYVPLWFEEKLTLQAFRTLLGAERFFSVQEKETLEVLLAESAINQQEVTDQLGRQVRKAVEVLVQAIDAVDKNRKRRLLKDVPVTEVYDAALTVMMRLVVLFSAEERKLLLLGDEFYDQYYAVSTIREQLRQLADRRGEEVLEFRFDAWYRLLAIFRAVHGGVQHDSFQLLPYNGSLFNPDRFPFLEGRTAGTTWREEDAEPVPINNRIVLHLLEALQVLRMKGPGGSIESRRLSFRTLDVEQIGHVYEGLLDHTALRADVSVLGLIGSKDLEPEIKLEDLERERAKGEGNLVAYLKEETKRSEKAIGKALAAASNDQLFKNQQEMQRLRTACDNDDELFERVRPFAGLLRRDTLGYPAVITEGSIYVTEGEDRRTTGTHYTPRSLTEEIVRYALEPLVYEGVAEGKPREEWRLRGAGELLELKVCDVACGSGAFLVQACRYLAERLVEAWEEIERANPGTVIVTPEGALSQAEPSERPLPKETDERLIVARRIVADRCLYGVDKNAMAVEMAKLSLWLITMQKDRPFTFLDHAIKWGDSLLGVTSVEQLESFALDAGSGTQIRIIAALCKPLLERASEVRRKLEGFAGDTLEDVRRKEELNREAEEAADKVRFIADLLIGEALTSASRRKKKWARSAEEAEQEQEAELDSIADGHEVLEQLVTETLELWNRVDISSDQRVAELQERAALMLDQTHPFHWVLEFPEVFSHAQATHRGFNAIVGNPPFIGGKKIKGALGTGYRDYLVEYLASGKRGHADLVAYFFLRAKGLLQAGGHFGLVATNTVAQGDTREVGLDQIVEKGGLVYRAVQSRPWPGTASLEVAHVWLRNGNHWDSEVVLDDKNVSGITPLLTEAGGTSGKPYGLAANHDKSFIGSYVLGMGFVLPTAEAQTLIKNNKSNADVLFPYLNGDDLNSRPDQSPSRWVINFFDWPLERISKTEWARLSEDERAAEEKRGRVAPDYNGPVAADYPDCLKIVEDKVKPERTRKDEKGEFVLRKPLPQKWWIYADKRPALYSSIAGIEHVMAGVLHTKYWSVNVCAHGYVFSHALVVFALNSYQEFALLESFVHEGWARKYSGSLETRLRYAPSDCFETFPFPIFTERVGKVGEQYWALRKEIMSSRVEGLTEIYNRFNDLQETSADIQRLRELHVEMDNTIADAYGWSDLDLAHGFHKTKQGTRFTISEAARREILDRLLQLNHERYAEEVAAGLHDKGAKKKTTPTKRKKGAKKQTRSTEASANSEDAPGDGNLFDYERQSNLF